ncbi:hypothetical protein SBF1_7880005 [Candidatus Desulfosporosinus infrequens]|uniref:Uncharacterized protein n=1 Tax=Candidatus Desulfosporosinus infrequens TaxID=2043169 RepID=A0A2U3LS77_9FIRM|nr:hypothetical protein SBF1_7880005 [Candidatus Desulfosporosinus infrequens]
MATIKFKVIMDICDQNGLGYTPLTRIMFDKLNDAELNNPLKIAEVLNRFKEYEKRMENNPNAYPERIMRFLRQRKNLNEFDASMDEQLNQLSPEEAFNEASNCPEFSDYDETFIEWIHATYDVKLALVK